MNIFQKLYEKYVTMPVANSLLSKMKTEELPSGMESWSVPLNYNLQYFNKVKTGGAVTYETLRNMSRFYEIVRSCIMIKQNQITQLEWDFTADADDNKDYKKEIALRKEWLMGMGGVKFSKLLKKIIEDKLVIDGVSLYKRKTYGGALAGITIVDPTTIKLRVDQFGLTPQSPEPAFEQWIRGSKTADLTTDEMIYHISNPRSDSPYGFSILEGLLLTIESFLKVNNFNLNYFTDGTMPEGFYELPAEWNLTQIKAYQEWWDTMMAGDPKNMRKIRFMPAATGGKGFTPAKSFDFNGIQPFLEWLMKITCSAFGVMPQELGFTEKVNKSSSQEQTEIAKRNSIKAEAFEIEELFCEIMKDDWILPNGQIIKANPALKFQFMNLDPKDELIDSQVTDVNIKNGLITINDWRKDKGLDPIKGADDPYIVTSSGPVWLSDFIAAKGKTMSTTDPVDQENTAEQTVEPNKDEKTKSTPKEDLKLWEKKALNDLKEGRAFRKFESESLDEYTLVHLPNDLDKCTGKEEIKACFKKYQDALDEGITHDVQRLYKKLDQILSD